MSSLELTATAVPADGGTSSLATGSSLTTGNMSPLVTMDVSLPLPVSSGVTHLGSRGSLGSQTGTASRVHRRTSFGDGSGEPGAEKGLDSARLVRGGRKRHRKGVHHKEEAEPAVNASMYAADARRLMARITRLGGGAAEVADDDGDGAAEQSLAASAWNTLPHIMSALASMFHGEDGSRGAKHLADSLDALADTVWLGGPEVADLVRSEFPQTLAAWSLAMQDRETHPHVRRGVLRAVTELARGSPEGQRTFGDLGWVQILCDHTTSVHALDLRMSAATCLHVLLVNCERNQEAALTAAGLRHCLDTLTRSDWGDGSNTVLERGWAINAALEAQRLLGMCPPEGAPSRGRERVGIDRRRMLKARHTAELSDDE